VLAVAANAVDSAVSKTCNVAQDMAWADFKNIYVTAYDKGCKGATTFNPGGKRLGIFIAKENNPQEEEGASCTFDPATGRKSCE
jgi:ribonucleoside-diphosphate reductase alpha chain